MIIRITDPHDYGETRSETYLENRFDVISRSGLTLTESHLIKSLPLLKDPKRLLILGNRTGVIGMIASRLYTSPEVIISSLDLFHHHAIERNLKRNPFTSCHPRCEAYLAETDYFDVVCLQLSKGAMPDELILDLLQQSHQSLRTGGQLFVTAEEAIPWLAEQIKKTFGRCSLRTREAQSSLLVGVKNRPLKKTKEYLATFAMTLPQGEPVQLSTIPGVFAHRRVDEGAQALAEVAVTQPGDLILDMGCGCGSVGLSLAKNQPTAEVCFVDSNVRATFITERNCQANGLSRYSVILSDQGIAEENRFSLFVGNPPYYSHDRISDLFIRTAYQALRPGGRAYLVAKQSDHNLAYMTELFGNGEIIHRRGYQIVKSVKP